MIRSLSLSSVNQRTQTAEEKYCNTVHYKGKLFCPFFCFHVSFHDMKGEKGKKEGGKKETKKVTEESIQPFKKKFGPLSFILLSSSYFYGKAFYIRCTNQYVRVLHPHTYCVGTYYVRTTFLVRENRERCLTDNVLSRLTQRNIDWADSLGNRIRHLIEHLSLPPGR